MKFNVDKCKVVHYGKHNIEFQYSLYGQPITEVASEKDLGVVFSRDLKVSIQCREAYSKASQSLGLIHTIIHKVQKPVSSYSSLQVHGKTTLGILFSSLESTLC